MGGRNGGFALSGFDRRLSHVKLIARAGHTMASPPAVGGASTGGHSPGPMRVHSQSPPPPRQLLARDHRHRQPAPAPHISPVAERRRNPSPRQQHQQTPSSHSASPALSNSPSDGMKARYRCDVFQQRFDYDSNAFDHIQIARQKSKNRWLQIEHAGNLKAQEVTFNWFEVGGDASSCFRPLHTNSGSSCFHQLGLSTRL
ncbi:unnamed protein product [Mesocestoides corti]|uniref:Uncharacterized protein n=1 Tax=Mesocestoides corti TaxID=53468 RepID=A0A0R3U5D1_MESCO|nr:unnamed protein product [Mesocestoides corti]